MSDNLERRVFIAGEEAAWLADKIVAYGEYGNDAARLLRLLSSTQQENEKLQAQVAMLIEGLLDAAESIQEWGNYADAYFQEKWNLAGDVEKYKALASASSDAWMKEQKAKVLEEVANWFESSPIIDAFWVRDVLKKMAAELRKE